MRPPWRCDPILNSLTAPLPSSTASKRARRSRDQNAMAREQCARATQTSCRRSSASTARVHGAGPDPAAACPRARPRARNMPAWIKPPASNPSASKIESSATSGTAASRCRCSTQPLRRIGSSVPATRSVRPPLGAAWFVDRVQSPSVGSDEDVVETRPAVGDPVDFVPAGNADQSFSTRQRRVDIGEQKLLRIDARPGEHDARRDRRSSCCR